MKAVLLTVMATWASLVAGYDEIYDKIDVDKILGDDTVFTGYLNCLLDKGPCDLEHSADFRKLLPEVIATACAKCTPIQRKNVRKMVKAITEKKPEEFKQFLEKYDPSREHEKAFTAFVLADD